MPDDFSTSGAFELLSPHLLSEARSDTARKWSAQALCVGADPEIFFPPVGDPATEARRICASCPVRGQCLAYAVTADEPFGIWGGSGLRERRSLRRQLQRRGLLPAPGAGTAA